MPYATPDDMVTRYGVVEMIRLTTPQDQDMVQVNTAPVLLALGDAEDLINGYVGKRYAVPFTTVPASIARATCVLARFDLSTGDGRDPSEQVRLMRKEVIEWLEGIAAGKTLLVDGQAAGDDSFAIMSDRTAVFGPGVGANVFPSGSPMPNAYPIADQGLGSRLLDNFSDDLGSTDDAGLP